MKKLLTIFSSGILLKKLLSLKKIDNSFSKHFTIIKIESYILKLEPKTQILN